MSKYLFPALLFFGSLLFLVFTQVSNVSRDDLENFATQAIAPSIQIGDETRPFCSGTMIGSNRDEESGEVTTWVLTARHCTETVSQSLEVIVPILAGNEVVEERHMMAKVVSRWAKHDLALLKLEDQDTLFPDVAILAPADVDLFEGEDTFVVGFALARARTITEGAFGYMEEVGVEPEVKLADFFRATPMIAPGNSGGALFHKTEDGEFHLIGVSSVVANGVWHVGYFVPITAIHEYVDGPVGLGEDEDEEGTATTTSAPSSPPH
jgi:S1-C subfamily serine protease